MKRLRKREGRAAQPSAAIIDSQSVKTSGVGGVRGYDGGKKILGRKRHILVDSMGLLIAVIVHSAGIQDRDGGQMILELIQGSLSKLKLIWADGGYQGRLVSLARTTFNRTLEIVRRSDDMKGFVVLPRRWVVERTFSWISHYRRHSRDYERLTDSSEAMIYVSMVQIMLKRLT